MTREGRKNNIVITTNFDSLTEDALFIYTKKKPLIVGHEALAHFINPNSSRPLIIKIHRDILFSPKNSEGELDDLPSAFVEGLHSILKQATPIIIGYGGNDGTLMGLLEKIEPLGGGMFWCRRETDSAPCRRIQEVVSKHNGRFVTVTGFDELMTQLGNRLEIPRQDGEVEQIASRRANAYREQLNKLLTTSDQQDSETNSAVSNIVERSDKKDWWYFDQLANKQKTLEEKDAVYRTGIEQIPDSAELLGNYAFFLEREKIDMVEAEKYYQMTLKVNPNHVNTICNYAIYLWHNKRDFNGAENYFHRAATVDSNDANYLDSYAVFLWKEKRDIVRAEEYFKKGIKSDSNFLNIVGNYANFLRVEKKDIVNADVCYQKALRVDPKDAVLLGNYATFLQIEKKDIVEAEEYYQKALKSDPKHAINLGNYSQFLIEQDKVDQSVSYLKRAFENNKGEDILELELWFYAYAVFYIEYPESREKIEELLNKGVRSLGWNLKGVLEIAKKHGHPDFEKLCEFERLITAKF